MKLERPLDRLIALTAVMLLLALVGCGVSAAMPPAATTQTYAPSPPPTATATATPVTSPTPAATPVPPAASAGVAGACPDPYADGVPFAPTPGETIHLRPTGTPPPIPRYEPGPLAPDAGLEAVIRNALGPDIGHYGIVVKRLDDGDGAAINAGGAYHAASLYKIWVMMEAFHQQAAGRLSFEERYVVSDYYASLRLNPGELALCSTVSAGDAIGAMMGVSDNVAAGMMIDRVGTANTNNMLRQFGLAVTGVNSSGEVYTTANGMEFLLEAIARHQVVSADASESMLALLASETIDGRLPALLPPGTRVAHKTGSWVNATNDAGIVYSPKATYVIVVLSDFGFADNADPAIAGLSRAVYDYFNSG